MPGLSKALAVLETQKADMPRKSKALPEQSEATRSFIDRSDQAVKDLEKKLLDAQIRTLQVENETATETRNAGRRPSLPE